MSIDLLNLEPHKVSRDLRGYSFLFYGDVKTGKTTNACKFPKPLLVATEKGYSAIPGVMAQPVNSWTEFLTILKQLENDQVKEKFSTIVIDTIDILYDYAEKYICNINGVSKIGEIPYGGGYSALSKELDEKLRKIVQLDYGLVLISHSAEKVFTDYNGKEYTKIIPTVPSKGKLIASRMCDIIGYSRQVEEEDGIHTYLFMRGTPRFEAGSRFPYTPDVIPFSYDSLVESINKAIDVQMEKSGTQYYTDEKENLYKPNKSLTDKSMNELQEEFKAVVEKILKSDASKADEISNIVSNYLGEGRFASDLKAGQEELLALIIDDVKALADNK